MNCVHHWNLDVMPAKCKYCGDEKVFEMAIKYASWNGSYEQRMPAYEMHHAIRSSKRYPVDR